MRSATSRVVNGGSGRRPSALWDNYGLVMAQPLFLTFEGIDGCGKTTQLLRTRQRDCGTQDGRWWRRWSPAEHRGGPSHTGILLDPHTDLLSSGAELLLYFASRAQNVAEVILPRARARRHCAV